MGSCLGALTLDSISTLLLDVETLEVGVKEVDSVEVDSELLTLTTIGTGTLTLEDLSELAQDKRSLDTELESLEVDDFLP